MSSLAHADITEIRKASPAIAATATLPIVAGVVVLAVSAFAGYSIGSVSRFWHAYLLGLMFCTSLGLGGLFFVIAHHLTGGRWGTVVRRIAELTSGTIGIAAILFLPILWLLFTENDALYPWADRAMVEADPILAGKADYLSPKWFAIRAVVYFFLWYVMARVMMGISLKQDTTNPMGCARRMQALSGPMALVFALSVNFASFDFLMSLEPHWFSTIFGVYFFTGSFEGFLALAIVLAIFLQGKNVLSQSITIEQIHDLAKLMFAFIVFWGYITFSQFLLIWYAGIPEETLWYDLRWERGWLWWGALLLFGHLFVPFLGAMSRAVRRTPKLIAFWAAWMLLMHWVDLVYIIMPQATLSTEPLPDGNLLIPWLELLVTGGMVLIFAGFAIRSAAGKWLLPVQDPRLPIALGYHNH